MPNAVSSAGDGTASLGLGMRFLVSFLDHRRRLAMAGELGAERTARR